MSRGRFPATIGRGVVGFAALVAASMMVPTHDAAAAGPRDKAPKSKTTDRTLLLADEVTYDKDNDVVTATGRVEIARNENILLADQVVYDRKTDIATATGHVSLIEANGTVLFVESAAVTSDLKQAMAKETLVLLMDKSRMTSRAFRRYNDIDQFAEGAYTACDVCDGRSPLWMLDARTVRRDIDARMIYYHDVWIKFEGVPVFYTPYLSTPDPTAGRKSGLLIPLIGENVNLGVFYYQPYYFNIAPDKDATLTPFLTTTAGKGVTFQYRQDFVDAHFEVSGSGAAGDPLSNNDFRGNLRSTGTWDVSDNWRFGEKVDLSSDQIYLQRYNLNRLGLTWLTNNVYAEHFDLNSYFSANGYYFERQLDAIAQPSPVVGPLLYYNYTSDELPFGGYLNATGSGVMVYGPNGADSDRISGGLGWTLPYTTGGGHIFTATASFRADGYYVTDYAVPSTGKEFTGTVGRLLPQATLKWEWPLERSSGSITQIIEPIAMATITPTGLDPARIPNEDSLDYTLQATNLFDPQRFAGYDLVEEGPRVSYGVRWSAYNQTGGTVSAIFGQAYNFHRNTQFAPATGLAGNLSDYVGEIDVSPDTYVSLQYRFRFNKDTFANRSSEITGVFGPDLFRVGVSYIDVVPPDPAAIGGVTLEKELYTWISTKLTRYWSLTASDRQDFGPNGGTIHTDVGLNYEDECFIVALDVSRNDTIVPQVKPGLGVLLRFTLKSLGAVQLATTLGVAP